MCNNMRDVAKEKHCLSNGLRDTWGERQTETERDTETEREREREREREEGERDTQRHGDRHR